MEKLSLFKSITYQKKWGWSLLLNIANLNLLDNHSHLDVDLGLL